MFKNPKVSIAGLPIKGATFLIAGPCSAETEVQLNETVDQLFMQLPNGVDLIRAGIWKPRTRPNMFEGVGEIGLSWLKQVGLKHKTPVCTEVANAAHVEMALKAGIDALWIGARTTVNPFSVQEIAEALKGVSMPIFIKNPINPDLDLWVGAIERFQNQDITNLAAIHRGFSPFEKSIYRNVPKWELPIALKQRLPDLPIICDPSHIGGKRDLILPISQQALDITLDGLMIETHCNPDAAWSDAAQQVTPADLNDIINQLVFRVGVIKNTLNQLSINEYRAKIDLMDQELLKTISQRMEFVREIGKIKKANNISILQLERWKEIVDQRKSISLALNLNEKFVESMLNLLHEESINQQNDIMNIPV